MRVGRERERGNAEGQIKKINRDHFLCKGKRARMGKETRGVNTCGVFHSTFTPLSMPRYLAEHEYGM